MINRFLQLFKGKKELSDDSMKKFLIAGLGNIGAEYVHTRHNIGFKVLDYFADKEGLNFASLRYGSVAEYSYKGRKFILLKPNTYMNLSGKALKYWCEKENIPLENVLVITDDLNLPFGTIRIRPKGSNGGHNGLKSIQETLGTDAYPRFRFGISDEFKKGQQVNYVLGEWDASETAKLPERLELSREIIKSFGTGGLQNTMTTYNGK